MAQLPGISVSTCELVSSDSTVIPLGSVKTLAILLFSSGFYVLLFSLAVYLRSMSSVASNKRLHLSWLVSLFCFSNAGAAIRVLQFFLRDRYTTLMTLSCIGPFILVGNVRDAILGALYHAMSILTNSLSNSIMIYRLHVIWGPRREVIAVLAVIVALTSCLGVVATVMTAVGDTNRYLGIVKRWGIFNEIIGIVYDFWNAIFNLLLTLTLAGHIWWINHRAHELLSPAIQQKYRTVIAILLESGILYPLTLLFHVAILTYCDVHRLYLPVDIAPLAIHMAGIAPTLIILPSTLNKSTDSVLQVLSTLRFEEREASVIDPSLDVESPIVNIYLDSREENKNVY